MRTTGIKKLYYSISEVSKITGLEQYVLRYWETEFDQLKPAKNRAGNRIYTNKDIKLIMHIKQLLRDEKYTIEGARAKIEQYRRSGELKPEARRALASETVKDLRADLKAVLALLDGTTPPHGGRS